MVLLTLVGSFMALTRIILHTISRIIYKHECKSEIANLGKASHSGRGPAGRYSQIVLPTHIMESMKLKVKIIGPKVHDVGYRYLLMSNAIDLGLKGFHARNRAGEKEQEVIALVEGDEEDHRLQGYGRGPEARACQGIEHYLCGL